jgi:hypothetical protein
MTQQADYQIGNDVFNNALNVMGGFRGFINNYTIEVITVRGLEDWAISDCTKFVSAE